MTNDLEQARSTAIAKNSCAVASLMLLLTLGCNPAEQAQRQEEARRQATVKNLKQIGESLHEDHETQPSPVSEFSHVILNETEYYTTGPQQGRPPDGTFSAGTKVRIVRDAGSYLLVRADSGVEAFVASSAVRQQQGQ